MELETPFGVSNTGAEGITDEIAQLLNNGGKDERNTSNRFIRWFTCFNRNS